MPYDPIYERAAYQPNSALPQGRAASGFQSLAEYIQRLAEHYNAKDDDRKEKERAARQSQWQANQKDIADHPERAGQLIQGMQGDPLWKKSGFDLNALLPKPEVGLAPLQKQIQGAKGMMDIPTDIPQAAQSALGPRPDVPKMPIGTQGVPNDQLPFLDQGGAPDYEGTTPDINSLMQQADYRKQSILSELKSKNAMDVTQEGLKSEAQAHGQGMGANAPDIAALKRDNETAMIPIEGQKAERVSHDTELGRMSPELQASRIYEDKEKARVTAEARLPSEMRIAQTRADISATEADRKARQKVFDQVAQNATAFKADIDQLKPLYATFQGMVGKNGVTSAAVPGTAAYKARMDYNDALQGMLARNVRYMDLLNRINIPEIKLDKALFPSVDLSPQGLTQTLNPQMAADRFKRLEEIMTSRVIGALKDPETVMKEYLQEQGVTPPGAPGSTPPNPLDSFREKARQLQSPQ